MTKFNIIKSYLEQGFWTKIVSGLIALLSVIIGIYTRFWWNIDAYHLFLGEQARDGDIMIRVWEGKLPKLGPPSSIGGYGIFPLYYYFGGLFFGFGRDPVLEVVSNMICSFGSIFLFGVMVYRSLGNSLGQKIILTSLSMLFWSIFAVDIHSSGFEWNPNSITFWLMVFVLLLDDLINRISSKYKIILYWLSLGFVVAMLGSLHSSTMFVAPVLLGISCIYWGFVKKNLYCMFGWAGFVISLAPYWKHELNTGFGNTRSIYSTFFGGSTEPKFAASEKLLRGIDTFWNMANYLYFPRFGFSIWMSLVLLFVIIAGFLVNRGLIGRFWILILCLYLVISSNYFGQYYIHYYAMVWATGLYFGIMLIGYLLKKLPIKNHSSSIFLELTATNNSNHNFFGFIKNNINSACIGAAVLVCGVFWGGFVWNQLLLIGSIYSNKYSNQRLFTTKDLYNLVKEFPENSRICSQGAGKSLEFVNRHQVKKNLTIEENCNLGYDFVVIPKYEYNYFFEGTPRNLDKAKPINTEVFLDNNQFVVYEKTKSPK